MALARRFNGEIINSDSRQVYRLMDVGTAKPTPEEQSGAPHHLLDFLDPNEIFGLGSFLSLARAAVTDIQRRNRVPVVAGGTGQYVWALLEGRQVPKVPPDPAFRRAREAEAEQHGASVIYQRLQEIDPTRAAQLDPRNVRRVIRALEIYNAAGLRPSDYSQHAEPMERCLVIGLTLDRRELYRRIDDRVDEMMAAGFLEEVETIASKGYPLGEGPLASLGYRELGQHLVGEISLEEAIQRTKFQTHRLARRQYTWFKLDDPRIQWLDASQPDVESRAVELTENLLSGAPPVLK